MAEDTVSELKSEIRQIRDVSIPRTHERLDSICTTMEKINDTLVSINNWKIETSLRVGFMGKLLAGVGALVLSAIAGLGGWLFFQIVDKAGK